ncbi:MAG: AI-2E family transporter [Rhodospirillaceae bacterium]|nr:MAG: AI-2E family transporter [Rhodospirillaceae bacterium]
MSASLRFWGVAIFLFVASLYLFRDILLPFVVGLGAAYFLDPITDRLEALLRSRTLATVLAMLAFYAAVFAFFLLFWPILESQIVALSERAPDYLKDVHEFLLPYLAGLSPDLSLEAVGKVKAVAGVEAGKVFAWAGTLVSYVWSGGLALFNLISLALITPIVLFYLLRDWDKIVQRVDGWLPKSHAPTIRAQLREIDRTLAGFVRGQATVCLMLAAFYGIGLALAGLDFGLVIGIATGLLSFIPYFGMGVGLVIGVTLAILQFSDWLPVAIVVGVFLLGQVLEGNFLTPKLVGERIGLHPVWVIFALLAGGTLAGFLGVVLAVPVAAVLGVMVRFAIRCYQDSAYYLGASEGEEKP